jgi:hypothetical protein
MKINKNMKLFYFNKEKLVYVPVKFRTPIIGFLTLIVLVFGLGYASSNKAISRIIHRKTTDTITIPSVPFSEKALIKLLESCNVKYPHIVLAQAKLESGNFTSKVFKQNNNMFGMRKARQRVTSAQGEKNTYASYRDWVDCVYDYAMYQSSVMCNVSNESEYFRKLGERYAEDSLYVSRLQRIIETEKLKNIFEN